MGPTILNAKRVPRRRAEGEGLMTSWQNGNSLAMNQKSQETESGSSDLDEFIKNLDFSFLIYKMKSLDLNISTFTFSFNAVTLEK